MIRPFPLSILLAVFVFLAACEQKTETAAPPKTSVENAALPPPGPKVEACAIVSDQDVAAIQKQPITGHQGNEVPTAEFSTTQCYYTSSTPNCSVAIAIIQRDPAKTVTRSVHRYWDDIFSHFRENDKKAEADREENEAGREQAGNKKEGQKGEEEEEKQHADKVDGVGEEAFWTKNAIGGILYTRQGEKIVRVSVGGPAKIEEKLEKSKALALKAIAALPK